MSKLLFLHDFHGIIIKLFLPELELEGEQHVKKGSMESC